MPTTASTLFSHELIRLPESHSGQNPLPLTCRFHFTDTPLLWYRAERVYLQSTQFSLTGLKLVNPERLSDRWRDEYYLSYYRDLFKECRDPLEDLFEMEMMAYRTPVREKDLMVLTDLQYLVRDGMRFKPGKVAEAKEVRLSVSPARFVVSMEVIEGLSTPIRIANFSVLGVTGLVC